jgi:hypothetical protein
MSSLQFISESYLPSRDVDYRSTPAAGTFYRPSFSLSLEKRPNCLSPATGVSLERANAVK